MAEYHLSGDLEFMTVNDALYNDSSRSQLPTGVCDCVSQEADGSSGDMSAFVEDLFF